MKRSSALLSFGIALCTAAASSAGSGRAMEGTDFARLLVPDGAVVVPYSNAGYRLEVEGEEARIFVEVVPLGSSAPLRTEPRTPPAATEIDLLARRLVTGVSSQYEAVSRILGWVSRNVRYRLDRDAPQGPEAVLERRSAYCTGFARLTVALLEALGVEAREVAGYVVGATSSGLSGYHRWIEVFYDDVGWVFSDPASTHHYVPANYVRLAEDLIDLSRGHDGLILERRDLVETADLYPFASSDIQARRNHRRQLAAALTVIVSGTPTGEVVLKGVGEARMQPLRGRGSTFVGLAPGAYELEVALDTGSLLRRRIELRRAVRAMIYLPAETGQSVAPVAGR